MFKLQETLSRSSSDEENELINFPNEDLYKMVIVVNSSLSMGVGKVAAQAAHGAVGLFKELMQQQQEYGEMLLTWDDYGFVFFITIFGSDFKVNKGFT